MTKDTAIKLLNIYGKAWITRDPDLIVSIFTDNATYDDPKEQKVIGREAIKQYWISKVFGEQSDISFDLQNVWVDTDTVIAEWYAEFNDTKRNLRIKMWEIAVFGVESDKFNSIREYYKTEKIPL
jgi:nuclear transport factor 2 (NTF2) superfamily protein